MDATRPPTRREEGRSLRREETRRRLHRQRRLALAAVLGAVGASGAIAVGALGGGEDPGLGTRVMEGAPEPPAPPQLPRGGRSIFPERRIVAYYGAPQADELGVLGIGPPHEVGAKLDEQARPYAARARPVLPAFELIATIASDAPGNDGKYRNRQRDDVIRRYLEAARRAKALLILDVQPGASDFVTETRALEQYLREPDVSLALDPEWRMDAGGVPGQSIGSVDAEEVNEVASYLSELVRRGDLPEKLLLVHQFTDGMIVGRERLREPPGVALTLNVDGFGTMPDKVAKYAELTAPPRRFHYGLKLFYREDEGLMSPRQVLGLEPSPDVIVYE